jgi:RimJ/RimL family protein N-acetyltransferase
MTVLQTDRLILRPLLPGDTEAYAAMRYHPEVAKWLLPAPGDPIDAARGVIERHAASWRDRGYGPWGVFREGRLIGQAGLNFVPEFGETEVLWSLHPEGWGEGFATEAGRAALEFGFSTLGLQTIFAMTKPDNRASQAVMKRLGLVYRKDVVYRAIDSVWFDIDRTTWLGSAGQKHL